MNLAGAIAFYCTGTSEGAKLAWDKRGRGEATEKTLREKFSVGTPKTAFGPIIITPEGMGFNVTHHQSVASALDPEFVPDTEDDPNSGNYHDVLNQHGLVRGIVNRDGLSFELFSRPTSKQVHFIMDLILEKGRSVYLDYLGKGYAALEPWEALDKIAKLTGISYTSWEEPKKGTKKKVKK